MPNGIVQADAGTIIAFQFAENDQGEKGQSAKDEERLMDAVNHFRGAGVKAVGNEERRGQRGGRDAETYGQPRY